MRVHSFLLLAFAMLLVGGSMVLAHQYWFAGVFAVLACIMVVIHFIRLRTAGKA